MPSATFDGTIQAAKRLAPMPKSNLDPSKAVQGDINPFETQPMSRDQRRAPEPQSPTPKRTLTLPLLNTNWGRIGVALGALATLTALISFFVLDLPEMIARASPPFPTAE